jgi:hypothetical protein
MFLVALHHCLPLRATWHGLYLRPAHMQHKYTQLRRTPYFGLSLHTETGSSPQHISSSAVLLLQEVARTKKSMLGGTLGDAQSCRAGRTQSLLPESYSVHMDHVIWYMSTHQHGPCMQLSAL